MTQPQTFREAAEQKERIDQQYKFRDIGYRRFVQEMESLDSHIVSLTIGKEALLDAAAELLDALVAIMADPPAWTTNEQCDAYDKALAAIAKATGRE